MTVNRSSVSRAVALKTGLTHHKANEATKAVLEAIAEALVQNNRVELRNFGIFEVKPTGKRKLKHPVTGKPITVEPAHTVKFRPANRLKQNLRKSKA